MDDRLNSLRFWRQYWALRRKLPHQILLALKETPKSHIVLDIGANIGVATKLFRSLGFSVVAFEPHPDAAALLRRRFGGDPHVSIHECAVFNETLEFTQLHLHINSETDPAKWSVGASLISGKPNTVGGGIVKVKQVDILEVLASLETSPIIKMDVEGAEVQILERLSGNAGAWQAQMILFEKHDFLASELIEVPLQRLRALFPNLHIFDNWP